MNTADSGAVFRLRERRVLVGCAVLLAGIMLVFGRVGQFAFLNFDDYTFITQNPHVASGLSWPNLVWAFQTGYLSAWLPLTWISHMLDVSLFGLQPGGHHLMSVGLHAAAALIFFLVLVRLTGRPGAAFVAAGIFAWHPLHVEPVVWLAARKDLLSVVLVLSALWCHVEYARIGGRLRYAGVVLFMALGLLGKAMALTFPVILLLLDYWPLGRFATADTAGRSRILREKIPLVVLAIVAAGLHFLMADRQGTVSTLAEISLGTRLANLPVAYGHYLLRFVWPTDLSIYYPYPAPPLWGLAALQWGGLGLVTALAWRLRQYPWLLVGWLWYVVYLVPAAGLIHQAGHLVANRYAYFPVAGLAVATVWGVSDLLSHRRAGV